MTRVAGDLEKTLKTGETGGIDPLLQDFESQLSRVMQSIEKISPGAKDKIENGDAVGRDPVDTGAVAPIISDLGDLLETDLVEARRRLEDLGEHLAGTELGELFRVLESQMDVFDIPAVRETIGAIADQLEIS